LAEDQEILAVLERRFTDLAERIDESRSEARQRFEQIDQRFEQIDQRFEQIDQRFGQVDQQFDRVNQRFEGVESEIRQAHVKIEAQSGEIRQIAEGVAGVDQKLEDFRTDVARRFDETHSLMRLSYGQLEQRVNSLEGRYQELDARVTTLEGNRH